MNGHSWLIKLRRKRHRRVGSLLFDRPWIVQFLGKISLTKFYDRRVGTGYPAGDTTVEKRDDLLRRRQPLALVARCGGRS